MTTLENARRTAEHLLEHMNINAFEVKLTAFDTSHSLWQIQGQFQNGILGEIVGFEGTFDPTHLVYTKFRLIGRLS